MSSALTRIEQQLSHCLSVIGTERFYPRFFAMMKQIAHIDQYCAFEFTPQGEPVSCRLSHSLQQPEKHLERASLYIDGEYLHDPLLQTLAVELNQQSKAIKSPVFARQTSKTLPPTYRQRFFNQAQIGEKFALIGTNESNRHAFYINFYRASGSAFSDEEIDALTQTRSLISALLISHFRIEKQQRGSKTSLQMAGLSEREAQVCELITQGHTAKTMARKMQLAESSVITFRKRAYKKLAIERKSQLLEWLANNDV